MLNRGTIFALAGIAAVVLAAFAPTDASAMLVVRGAGPHPYAIGRSPLPVPARVHGCPGGMKREHVCVRWYAPHGGGPNPPTPVCIRYEWVNRCTT
jgi:hypothetical protein